MVRRLSVFVMALALLGMASGLALAAHKRRHHHITHTVKPGPCALRQKAKHKSRHKRARHATAARRHRSRRHKASHRAPCSTVVHRMVLPIHQANGPYPGAFRAGHTDDEGAPALPLGPYRPNHGPRLAVPATPTGTAAREVAHTALAADPTAPVEIGAEVDPASAGLGTAGADQESSEAIVGSLIFFTSNFRTGYSTDFGRTFTALKPEGEHAGVDGVFEKVEGGFCCDQVVIYAPEVDRVFWILQYGTAEKQNIIRVAWASPAAIAKDALHAWQYTDLESKSIVGAGQCLDQPHVGLVQGYLLLAINGCNGEGKVFESVMFELTLSTVNSKELGLSYAISKPQGMIPARGQGNLLGIVPDIFYFVGQKNTSELRVFYWKAVESTTHYADIPIPTVATRNWASTTPGGANWMARQEESQATKVTGATLAGGRLWAAWSAGRETVDSEKKTHPDHAQPSIEGTIIPLHRDGSPDASNTPFTYSNNTVAVAMPDLATNADGEVGLSFMQGGGGFYPRHVVAIISGTPQFAFDIPGSSDSNPSVCEIACPGDPAGDYTTVGVEYPSTKCFTSSGVAHEKAEKAPSAHSLPRVLTFGRRGVEGGCAAPPPPFPPSPKPSHMTISCPAQITAGEAIAVSGSLTPARPGVGIRVQFTRPEGGMAETVVSTDAAGNYATSDLTSTGETGTWRVVASWAGESGYAPSSAGCAVHAVTPPGPEQLPSSVLVYCPYSGEEIEGVEFFQAGQTVTTHGGVYLTSPPRPYKAANVPVILDYVPENPLDTEFKHTVMTNEAGDFTDSVTLPAEVPGYWDIYAYWNGDAQDQGATSGTCRIYQREAIH
jgi:hypothetical protein